MAEISHVALPDRSERLRLFGLLGVLCGMGCFALAALHLALPFLSAGQEGLLTVETESLVTGTAMWFGAGAALVLGGVGSWRRRRWAPPLMSLLSWTWLLFGAMSALLFSAMIDSLTELAPDPAVRQSTAWILRGALAGIAVCGVGVPALFVWAFRGDAVRETCRRHAPPVAWIDRAPRALLGLGLAMWLAALLLLPMVLLGAVPVFHWIVRGPMAAILVTLVATACALSGSWLIRAESRGLWATAGLIGLLGLSAAGTLLRYRLDDLMVRLGYEAELAAMYAGVEPWWGVAAALGVTVGSLWQLSRAWRQRCP